MKAYFRKFFEWAAKIQAGHRFAYLTMSASYASNCAGADDFIVGIVSALAYLWLATAHRS